MDFLSGLNPQQREAVAHVEGPLLILAGAGSGKTRVITHRIAHLMTVHHVPGWAIMAVTFTNKAAAEMKDRVLKLVQGAVPAGGAPTLSTFHSFCVRLLRRDGSRLADIRPGFTRDFLIYDEDEQLGIVKSVYRAMGLDEKKFMQYRAALSRISHAKNHKESPSDVEKAAKDPITRNLAAVYDKYEGALRQANALDFDDLLLEAVRLLRHDGEVRDNWNRRLQHLMIDEYQDTNRSQYELMLLLSEIHRNVCVVGDEDQSIYSWRGADIRNILDFEKDFADAKVIRLEQNYRSTKNILESASSLIANNNERKGKWLWTESGSGEKIGVYEAYEGSDEAVWVADTIRRLLAQHPDERAAVLYRTNFQSRQIEEALRRYGQKYLVVGGFSFYQRAEVKDALAYLKAALQAGDSISLLRIINTPARGIGKSTVEQLEKYAVENNLTLWDAIERMLEQKLFPTRAEAAVAGFRDLLVELRTALASQPLDEALSLIIDRTGYKRMLATDNSPDAESRLENLQELVNAAAEARERGEGPTEFLDHAALVSESDQLDQNAPVSLLTVHNAKGLEFPIVFVTGLEEGLFPHSRSLQSESMMEEERRLCYVAMTRAEKRLFLSWARSRRRFGGGQAEPTLPSRFLKEVPEPLTDQLGERRGRAGHLDLYSERHEVREAARRNTYTGKTYNSVENIAQYFAQRGLPVAPRPPAPTAAPKPAGQPVAAPPARKKQGMGIGATVDHPKYGRGTILRKEGDGGDAKLTVSFPGYGLKKLIAKYAGLAQDE